MKYHNTAKFGPPRPTHMIDVPRNWVDELEFIRSDHHPIFASDKKLHSITQEYWFSIVSIIDQPTEERHMQTN